ncbi:hypothetical protein DVU_1269 [Nitratidesulfovibrio vulgaris str. Hildenborough]|uniref:Uncharacterized protein n=1 Tax=Nitratidesulfovibrio vulgaris (strain ATCC 29579 / DSM 644 / CCUG 34227 / NCIMB 8303 / VKM B-1760 / Hildenborough) TaxID=882 RepID=Q72CL4_NITV2|nr:hypothetical protein DVU_1269 [Nitratidesulfovibrio vulgaris str. Hildenborough]
MLLAMAEGGEALPGAHGVFSGRMLFMLRPVWGGAHLRGVRTGLV